MAVGSNLRSSSDGSHQDWWILIWSLNVPEKVILLVWRAIVGVLPYGRAKLLQKIKESGRWIFVKKILNLNCMPFGFVFILKFFGNNWIFTRF